jgi:hypothetical protein
VTQRGAANCLWTPTPEIQTLVSLALLRFVGRAFSNGPLVAQVAKGLADYDIDAADIANHFVNKMPCSLRSWASTCWPPQLVVLASLAGFLQTRLAEESTAMAALSPGPYIAMIADSCAAATAAWQQNHANHLHRGSQAGDAT